MYFDIKGLQEDGFCADYYRKNHCGYFKTLLEFDWNENNWVKGFSGDFLHESIVTFTNNTVTFHQGTYSYLKITDSEIFGVARDRKSEVICAQIKKLGQYTRLIVDLESGEKCVCIFEMKSVTASFDERDKEYIDRIWNREDIIKYINENECESHPSLNRTKI